MSPARPPKGSTSRVFKGAFAQGWRPTSRASTSAFGPRQGQDGDRRRRGLAQGIATGAHAGPRNDHVVDQPQMLADELVPPTPDETKGPAHIRCPRARSGGSLGRRPAPSPQTPQGAGIRPQAASKAAGEEPGLVVSALEAPQRMGRHGQADDVTRRRLEHSKAGGHERPQGFGKIGSGTVLEGKDPVPGHGILVIVEERAHAGKGPIAPTGRAQRLVG